MPTSDGTAEHLGADVVHFTFQNAFVTDIPSVYQPWDLQHIHMPEFFSVAERERREQTYRAFCKQAAVVITATQWVKEDIVSQYQIPEDDVAVVNVPPPTTAYAEATSEDFTALRSRLKLPHRFVYYPAQTWPHKNHRRLFEALAILRQRGLRVPLVCSGAPNEHDEAALQAARAHGVGDQVVFAGYITESDVVALYQEATALVFPTLYEGWGIPIVEAFRAGLPVACSNVTSLPRLAGDAAVLFDPLDAGAIADAVKRIWLDEEYQATLAIRGRQRVSEFSWQTTALLMRAHYRRIAGRQLNGQEQRLLSMPSLV